MAIDQADIDQLHILIVDDEHNWQDHVRDAMRIRANELFVQVQITIADSSREAERAVRCEHYHGISIDQNLPREKGGQPVTAEEGMRLIEGLEAYDPPAFMAIYTGFPGTSYANRAGRPQIDYIHKSSLGDVTVDGNRQMDGLEYGEFFIDKVLESFLPRSLRLVEASGFSELRAPARNARLSLEAFAASGFLVDDLAHDFFEDFSKFREHFMKVFAAFTFGLVSTTDSIQAPKSWTMAKVVDDWLKNTWQKAAGFDGQKSNMEAIRRFLHQHGDESLGSSHLVANERLRTARNDVIHNQKRFTADDYKARRADMFRVMDLAALLMRCKFAVQMYRTRPNYLTYKDLNWARARPGEIFYSGNPPESKPNDVFALLPGLDRPIRITRGLRAERDDTPAKDLKLVTEMP